MTYKPMPINTTNIELSPELLALTETLAANNHDIWAAGRIAEGWRYGPMRDDAKKTHPDLVPYDQLPEEEKQYDRNTVLGTIKTIIAMGYHIAKAGS